MKNSINLNSQEWCDIVFEDRNKQYGAYSLRQSSAKRHLVAFGTVVLLMASMAALPTLMGVINDLTTKNRITIDDPIVLSDVPVDATPLETKIEKPLPPPPPAPKVTEIKFVPPVIAEDKQVKDQLKTIEEVNSTKGIISTRDVEGDPKAKITDIPTTAPEPKVFEEKKEEKPIFSAEQMPAFPGGEAEMMQYLSNNLKYPVVAQEQGIQGRVTVRFVVTKTGNIENVEIMRGIDPSCDKEALRVVKNMPRWIPGKQNGNPVAVYFTLPIVFKLRN